MNVAFLDGKKLGILRTVEKAAFSGLEVHLAWSPGPSAVIVFPDEKSAETLRKATEAARGRALQSPPPGGSRHRTMHVLDDLNPSTPQPVADSSRRRPVR